MPTYKHNQFTDDIIRRVYSTPSYAERRKRLPEAVAKLKWPRHVIYMRAVDLGIIIPLKKSPDWTEAEDEILHENAHLSPRLIAKKLTGAGHPSRSHAAIQIRIKRVAGGVRQATIDAGIYSADGLGMLLGVPGKSVIYWIDHGRMKSMNKAPSRGNPHKITRAEVYRFIKENPASIDLCRCDKFWLIDLLTSSGPRS